MNQHVPKLVVEIITFTYILYYSTAVRYFTCPSMKEPTFYATLLATLPHF